MAQLARLATPRALLLGAAGLVLVVHSLAYNFVTDDAYISFVFSRNFAEHGELTFNPGMPVEGYTNFLWTFVLGILMLVGIPPEYASRFLGTVCALATLWLVCRIVDRALERRSPWAVLPAWLLACSSGFACWTSGGLETQLFTMLVVGALDAVIASTTEPRAIRRAGWLLALAAMTRPEGPLLAAMLGAARVVQLVLVWRADRKLPPVREELIAAAWFLGIWLPWFAWRWWYYGHPFPNTYYVKASGDWLVPKMAGEMRDAGFHYIWVWLAQTRLLWALPVAAIGLVAVRGRTPRFVATVACGLVAAVYVPYAISVGGDFMGLHRFIMPMFAVAAIAVTLGLEWLARRVPGAWSPRRFAIPAVAGLILAAFAFTQVRLTADSLPCHEIGMWSAHECSPGTRPKNTAADRGVIDTPAFLMVYTEDRATIGRAFAGCFRDNDFSIFGGVGAKPYFSGGRGVDVFGLVSAVIGHEEPRMRPRAGHTKWGSDEVLYRTYNPTFVFHCYDLHRTAAQPQLGHCSSFWRARGYELVTMHIPGLRERGEYYTFLAKKTRAFQCPGRIK
ncbi:MAG: hypothetical protein KF773_17925 [Deltaproteobacteria bacterium]|nr:hypothetical protein [Deltaproteobacteria bacterium]